MNKPKQDQLAGNKMQKIFLALVVAGALPATSLLAAFDGVVVLAQDTSSATGYSYGSGGEFRAATTPNGAAANLGSFQTFCIEYHEQFSLGGSYYYRINGGAVSGGNNTGNGSAVVANYDPVSIGTAYLYSQFRAGNLYDTTTFGAPRVINAGELQNALWFLEDEGGSLSSAMVTALTTGLGSAGAGSINWKKNSNGAYGVVALNLFSDAAMTVRAQDQLGMVPVPEASTIIAGALLLLPFGASTIRFLRKNRTA